MMIKLRLILMFFVMILIAVSCTNTKLSSTPILNNNVIASPSQSPITPLITGLPLTVTPIPSTKTELAKAFTPIPPTKTILASTITPTLKPLSMNATATLTPVSSVDPNTKMKVNCVKESSTLADNKDLEGAILFSAGNDNYLFIDPKTSEQTTFIQGESVYGSVAISPSHKNMYYEKLTKSGGKSTLMSVVASMDGVITTFPYKQEWMFAWWLNNDRLISETQYQEPHNSVTIIDPVSGEELEMTLNLPDPYFAYTPQDSYLLPVDMDPTMTRVIYFDDGGIGRLILWNISTQEMLAWLPYPVPDTPGLPPGGGPDSSWSLDGSQFVTTSPVRYSDTASTIPSAEELFSISRDGQVKQLTHFSAVYGFVRIYRYQQSPDGRYIAFWLQVDEDKEKSSNDVSQRLVVLDTVTEDVIDYCISISGQNIIRSSPVWSPNSHQLVANYESDNGEWPTILLDIVHNFVKPITDNIALYPLGWMVNP